MSKSIKLKNGVYLDSKSILANQLHNTSLEECFNNAVITCSNGYTNVDILVRNGWGFIFVITSYRMGILQFQGRGTAPYVHNIYNALDEMQFSWNNDVLTINNLYNWENYMFIGNQDIKTITPH